MDAMALLCMLHADGPSTLKSLRQAGCSSLESIEGMEEERLSRLLGGPPAAARRFAREARHLRERLGAEHPGGGILDREESVVETLPPQLAAIADLGALDPRPKLEPVAGDFVDVDEVMPVASSALLTPMTTSEVEDPLSDEDPSSDCDPVEQALETWRTLDREDAPESVDAVSVHPVSVQSSARARPEYEFGSELASAIRELAGSASAPETRGAPSIDGTRLVPGGLDGLDPELCLELAAAGLETVEALADSDPLRLSETLGIAYGKLWRLGCIARRTLTPPTPETSSVLQAVSAMELAAPPVLEKLSPSERPWKPAPSILELEWNREIRPQAPPPGHTTPYATDVTPERAREAEGAGGPFV
jgi:hypothetical protein